VVGVAYAAGMSHWPGFPEAASAAAQLPRVPSGAQLWSYPLLAIVAAPLVEEVIFRGLIYRSLRATLSINVSAALASAIFALAHPGLSFAPVFVMGFLAARALERSGSLISAMVVHAIYNAALMVATALIS
jgi:ABC-2 type transport system permease protein